MEGYCFWCNFDKDQKETRVTCLVLCTCEFSSPIFTLGIKKIPPPSQTVNSAHHLSVSCRICFLTFIPRQIQEFLSSRVQLVLTFEANKCHLLHTVTHSVP